MSDKIFAEGVYWSRRDSAPDYVIGRIGIDVERFVKWLEKQPTSERGYLNLNVLRGRNGKEYVELDTWQPGNAKAARSEGREYGGGGSRQETPVVDFDDSIPFMTHERGWLC